MTVFAAHEYFCAETKAVAIVVVVFHLFLLKLNCVIEDAAVKIPYVREVNFVTKSCNVNLGKLPWIQSIFRLNGQTNTRDGVCRYEEAFAFCSVDYSHFKAVWVTKVCLRKANRYIKLLKLEMFNNYTPREEKLK